DRWVGQQFLERPETEQLVDEHLLERELLASVERDLQLGEDLADDRTEFFGELILAERGRGFRVDALEQTRKHLFLDAVDGGLETLALAAGGFAAGVLARRQAIHRPLGSTVAVGDRRVECRRQIIERRELVSARFGSRGADGSASTLHRFGDAEV